MLVKDVELPLGGFSAPSVSRKYMQQTNEILKKQTKKHQLLHFYTFTSID